MRLGPITPSLSEMDGRALCFPAFPQLALIHEGHRDGVNHVHPHPLAVAVYGQASWVPVGDRIQELPRGRGCSGLPGSYRTPTTSSAHPASELITGLQS
jgi:hypothetical protein